MKGLLGVAAFVASTYLPVAVVLVFVAILVGVIVSTWDRIG